MFGIDLEDRLECRHLLTDRSQNALQVGTGIVCIGDEARGRGGKSQCDAYVLHAFAQRLLHALRQFARRLGLLPRLILLGLALELAQL